MKKFMHGTSIGSAKEILDNGFSMAIITPLWDVSDEDLLYVVDADSEDADRISTDASVIASAVRGEQSDETAVFIFEMSDEIAEKHFNPDDSCPDMDDCYEIDKAELDQLISSGLVSARVEIRVGGYNPNLRAVYLTGVVRDNGTPSIMIEDDSALFAAVKLFRKTDIFIDAIEDSYGYSVKEIKSL